MLGTISVKIRLGGNSAAPDAVPVIVVTSSAESAADRLDDAGGDRQQSADENDNLSEFHGRLHKCMSFEELNGFDHRLAGERYARRGRPCRYRIYGRRRDGSSNSAGSSIAALMNGNVDDTILHCRNVISRGHVFPVLAGPARLDPVGCQLAVIDDRIAHGIGAAMR